MSETEVISTYSITEDLPIISPSDTEPKALSETSETAIKTGTPEVEEWKKYPHYCLAVDPDQDEKATTIKLCSLARPHMSAFHLSWCGDYSLPSFSGSRSHTPLLSEIQETVGLTKQEIWTSSKFVGVTGTILMRFA